MPNLEKIKEFVSDLPWADLRKAYDALVASGQHPREAAVAVAHLVDELVDFEKEVPGEAGKLLEAADYPVARILIGAALRYTRKGS